MARVLVARHDLIGVILIEVADSFSKIFFAASNAFHPGTLA
jgi:hypothetical protein